MKDKAPKTERNLLQVRLSENEKRNIKMMAAGQGLTLREATLAAFTAWAKSFARRRPPPKRQKLLGNVRGAGAYPGGRRARGLPYFGNATVPFTVKSASDFDVVSRRLC